MRRGELLLRAAHLGGPLTRPRRWILVAVAFLLGVLWLSALASAAPRVAKIHSEVSGSGVDPALVPRGRTLFHVDCASCHGFDAAGIPGRAPSLHGVGALAADFMLETGRMPLDAPSAQPTRTRPAYPAGEIRALVAFVASFGGPTIPSIDLRRGSLPLGEHLFALNCAGCHTIQAIGGVVTGAIAPSLRRSTPRQIGEAMRLGPYLMPVFGPDYLSLRDLDSIARYVVATHRSSASYLGGWPIGRVGPVAEGLVTWFGLIPVLLIVCRLLGERMPDPRRGERA